MDIKTSDPHVIFIQDWPRAGDMWPYGGAPLKEDAVARASTLAALNMDRTVWVAPFGTTAAQLPAAAVAEFRISK